MPHPQALPLVPSPLDLLHRCCEGHEKSPNRTKQPNKRCDGSCCAKNGQTFFKFITMTSDLLEQFCSVAILRWSNGKSPKFWILIWAVSSSTIFAVRRRELITRMMPTTQDIIDKANKTKTVSYSPHQYATNKIQNP